VIKGIKMLTQKRLKELFNYNPETGLFTRLVDRGNTKSGDIAGTTGKQGYTYISVDYKIYSAHRLAFLYMTGEIPAQVDHQDHIKNNNTWINLSPSNPELNAKNMFLPSHNTSGVIGTYWSNRRKCWYAEIKIKGKKIHLGGYKTLEEAAKVRQAANIKYGFHKNHGVKSSVNASQWDCTS
jgi:hypothetical protein